VPLFGKHHYTRHKLKPTKLAIEITLDVVARRPIAHSSSSTRNTAHKRRQCRETARTHLAPLRGADSAERDAARRARRRRRRRRGQRRGRVRGRRRRRERRRRHGRRHGRRRELGRRRTLRGQRPRSVRAEHHLFAHELIAVAVDVVANATILLVAQIVAHERGRRDAVVATTGGGTFRATLTGAVVGTAIDPLQRRCRDGWRAPGAHRAVEPGAGDTLEHTVAVCWHGERRHERCVGIHEAKRIVTGAVALRRRYEVNHSSHALRRKQEFEISRSIQACTL
jgi:hypothetical protein